MISGALASRIEPHDLLAQFSLEIPRALPTLSKCPVCGREASLEVAYGHNRSPSYWCGNPDCWFQGDGVQLYRAVTKKPLQEACYDLVAAGVIPREIDLEQEIACYCIELAKYQDSIWSIWQEANQAFMAGSSPASGILQSLGCWESYALTCGATGLGRHLGVLRGSRIKELPRIPKHIEVSIQSSQHYLVMPLWLDRWVISGFLFFSSRAQGQQYYWPILSGVCGVGLVHTTGMNEPVSVGCDRVVDALTLVGQGVSNAYRAPVVYLPETSSSWGFLVAQRRLMLNVNRRVRMYKQALAYPECQVLVEGDVHAALSHKIHHPKASISRFLEHGYQAHQAVSAFLCSIQTGAACAAVKELELTPADTQRILSVTPEHHRPTLDSIFRQDVGATSIKFGNDTISCTAEGWRSSRRGSLVCNAVFFVDQIVVDTGSHQATATGSVLQGGKSFKFTSPMRDVETRTQAWLQGVLAENRAGWLEVEPGWANKLFAISRNFRSPKTVYTSNSVGWVENGHRLVLPAIVVEGGSVGPNPHPIQGGQCGQGLACLSPSPHQVLAWAKDDDAGRLFWALFGLVSCNLLNPFHKYGTFGIGVVDRPQGLLSGLVLDLVDQVVLQRVSFRNTGLARMQEIWDRELKSPLPLYIEEVWASNDGFAKWLGNKQARNCVVMMSRPVAIGTCLDGGWAYLKSTTPTTDERSRYLGAWNLLPLYMAWVQLHPIEWPTIRSGALPALYASLKSWLESLGADPAVLVGAQRAIELDMLERTSSWSSKFMSFLLESVECGLLQLRSAVQGQDPVDCLVIDHEADLVFISRATLTKLFAQMGLPVPNHQHIVSMLQAGKALSGTRYHDLSGYAIPHEQWSFYYSLRGTR